jgi:hypothetical protein
MSSTVTFRLDPETARILKELMRHEKTTKSRVIRQALRARWRSTPDRKKLTAWEVYSKMDIPQAKGPRRDRARNIETLMREMLVAKRRAGTL